MLLQESFAQIERKRLRPSCEPFLLLEDVEFHHAILYCNGMLLQSRSDELDELRETSYLDDLKQNSIPWCFVECRLEITEYSISELFDASLAYVLVDFP